MYHPPSLQLIRPFIDPVTAHKIHFLQSSSPDTLKALDEVIGLHQLEHGFGGQAQWEFDVSEYAAMMREDDRRVREHWGVEEKGVKDVGWLPSKPPAVHGWGHALRHGHAHGHVHNADGHGSEANGVNGHHVKADKQMNGEPGSAAAAAAAASGPASPHKRALGFELKRPAWLAGKQ